jgi:hypothetical protein
VSASRAETFVVFASRRALEEAEVHGIGVVENLTEKAILAGRVNGHGHSRRVRLGDGIVAHTITTEDRTAGGRRKVLITSIQTDQGRSKR